MRKTIAISFKIDWNFANWKNVVIFVETNLGKFASRQEKCCNFHLVSANFIGIKRKTYSRTKIWPQNSTEQCSKRAKKKEKKMIISYTNINWIIYWRMSSPENTIEQKMKNAHTRCDTIRACYIDCVWPRLTCLILKTFLLL